MRSVLPSLLLLVSSPLAISAQFVGFGGAVAEADMLYLAGRPRLAFETLQAHLAVDSTDYEALWRAARAAVVVGFYENGSRVQNGWLDPAIRYANLAVELRPEGLEGVYWRGAATGRRALNASPGYAVELAERVYDDAHRILAVDSLHGGAHNILGKLNYEIMSLSRVQRAFARAFMGNDALDDASWENAEFHLARAAKVWPEFILFHSDLAELYRKRGRREEAADSFRRVLEVPPVHPIDQRMQAEARGLLEEWGEFGDSTTVESGSR
jgi:tetratricopeptide (TPR) repeat protein